MEQVDSSASDDQNPSPSIPHDSCPEQTELAPASAVPPPTPEAVPGSQIPRQQAQTPTDGYGTGGHRWLTRSVNLVERRSEAVMLAVCALLAAAGGVVAVHEGPTLKFADESQYVAIADNLVSHGTFSLTGQGPTAYRPPT